MLNKSKQIRGDSGVGGGLLYNIEYSKLRID